MSKAVGKMTTNVQQGTLLDVLKKKMRQTKEEMEKYKDECEDYHKKLQVEVMRREEVSQFSYLFALWFAEMGRTDWGAGLGRERTCRGRSATLAARPSPVRR